MAKAQMRNGPADQRLAHNTADRLLHDGIGMSTERQVPLQIDTGQPIVCSNRFRCSMRGRRPRKIAGRTPC